MEWIAGLVIVCLIWYIIVLKRELNTYIPKETESEYARTIRRVHEQYGLSYDPKKYGIIPSTKRK